MRAGFVGLVLLCLGASCSSGTTACKKGTAFLRFTLSGGAQAADTLDITLAIGAALPQTMSVPTKGHTSGSVEIDFHSYPAGQQLTLTVSALHAGQLLAASTQTLTASAGCTPVSVSLTAAGMDLSTGSDMTTMGDLGSINFDSMSNPDLTPGQLATPRLLSPMSGATVTQQAPTLSWLLGPGGGTAEVDLCHDRACTRPFGVTVTVAGTQTSAVPTAPLPNGWIFWRVRMKLGSQTATSATWQFWVGAASATSTIDSSGGVILDVNGDGFADYLVGAQGADLAHLYLGSASGVPQRIDLTSPDGASTNFGANLSAAGDIDGDGFGDFLISSANGTAHVGFLYFGEPSPSPGNVPEWNGPTHALRIDLPDPNGTSQVFGGALAGAGDINRDGYGDFVIGTPGASSNEGTAFVYFGMPSPNPSPAGWLGVSHPQRILLTAPSGTGASGQFGNSVSAAGDVDGDGYADFLVGAVFASSGAGAAHLYFGESLPAAAAPDWNGASSANRIDLSAPCGDGSTAAYGNALSAAGDINNDGHADFVVAASAAGGGVGAVHVYLGESKPPAAAPDWNGGSAGSRSDVNPPAADGSAPNFGTSVAGAGDVDDDGGSDFVVGANGAGTGGAAHLYYSAGVGAPGVAWNGTGTWRTDLTSPDGSSGGFGQAAAGVGDSNGDGFSDFLVGALNGDTNGGAAHLYSGEKGAGQAAPDWNINGHPKRTDLANPDATTAAFGSSVAMRQHGAHRKHHAHGRRSTIRRSP